MSDTPISDSTPHNVAELGMLCRRLERQLTAANERIKRLEDSIAKQNTEIEQTCGKVLDYPWHKNDQKNFPGSTEVDGVCVGEHIAETIASELARKYTGLKHRIKRLEAAGDAMEPWCSNFQITLNWNKAKEAKL